MINGSYELFGQVGTALADERDEPLAVKLCAFAGRRARGAQRRVERLAGQRLSGADDGPIQQQDGPDPLGPDRNVRKLSLLMVAI